MPFQANVFEVVVAAPSDTERYIQQAIRAINDWNRRHGKERQICLIPRLWKTDATPIYGGRGQRHINEQVIDYADVLVAIFKSRIGSPTGESPSGTIEEVRRHHAAGKVAKVYFWEGPHRNDVDAAQLQAVRNYRTECEQNGLIGVFKSGPALYRDLIEDLLIHARLHLAGPSFQSNHRHKTDVSLKSVREPRELISKRKIKATNTGQAAESPSERIRSIASMMNANEIDSIPVLEIHTHSQGIGDMYPTLRNLGAEVAELAKAISKEWDANSQERRAFEIHKLKLLMNKYAEDAKRASQWKGLGK